MPGWSSPGWMPSLAGMAVWVELSLTLARLLTEQPGALRRYPDPSRGEAGTPPYRISLAAWAESVAGELNRRFGDDVDLTVGALPYPPGRPPRRARPRPPGEPADPLDPREAEAELDGPAVVRSGHTLRHRLLIRNHTGDELVIATNGQVTASVVDPESGEVVGGFAGYQTLPLVTFRAAAGQTVPIPLLIGTASRTERLGYALPPGTWGLQATLKLARGAETYVHRRTPVLPLTITA